MFENRSTICFVEFKMQFNWFRTVHAYGCVPICAAYLTKMKCNKLHLSTLPCGFHIHVIFNDTLVSQYTSIQMLHTAHSHTHTIKVHFEMKLFRHLQSKNSEWLETSRNLFWALFCYHFMEHFVLNRCKFKVLIGCRLLLQRLRFL